eukprot:m.274835 g.274835  ORF g.274835 m.274835 type:complete len:89 (+) comp54842_c0_seq6:82-348(+)
MPSLAYLLGIHRITQSSTDSKKNQDAPYEIPVAQPVAQRGDPALGESSVRQRSQTAWTDVSPGGANNPPPATHPSVQVLSAYTDCDVV